MKAKRRTSLLMFLLLSSLPTYAQPGWTIQEVDTSLYLKSVKAVGPVVAWVCGNGGVVLRTMDGGTSWINVGGGAIGGAACEAIEAVGTDTAYVCINSGSASIYRTTNGGLEWTPVALEPEGFFNAVRMMDHLNGVALGDPVGGTWVVLRTSDGGATWDHLPDEPVQVGAEYGFVNSLAIHGTSRIWFGASEHNLYRSSDAGASWSAFYNSSDDGFGIWFNDSLHGVAACSGGAYHTSDGGITWVASDLGTTLYGVAGGGSSDFWATRGETIYHSTDHGMTWSISYTDPESFFSHLSFVTEGTMQYGWAVGGNRVAYYSGLIAGFSDQEEIGVTGFRLMQNYPNPFNPVSAIEFSIPQRTRVTLVLQNVLGEQIGILHDGELERGSHRVSVSARDLASGVYFYQLRAGQYVAAKKLVVLK
jgi:photosystem II stability/assembly factor-like uncharacterized protein